MQFLLWIKFMQFMNFIQILQMMSMQTMQFMNILLLIKKPFQILFSQFLRSYDFLWDTL